MIRTKILFKFSWALIITFLSFYPLQKLYASYTPVDGRVSYLAGVLVNTNFQEKLFNNSDTQSKLGRSQSFALLFQSLGDLSEKGSLMAEVTVGSHKFIKKAGVFTDEFRLDAIAFDLGYRRYVGKDVWVSTQIGSMYPWRIGQNLTSSTTNYNDSDFSAIYSVIIGVQYETELFTRPVSYDFRIRKYMSSQLDDQAALSFSIGWRFGSN